MNSNDSHYLKVLKPEICNIIRIQSDFDHRDDTSLIYRNTKRKKLIRRSNISERLLLEKHNKIKNTEIKVYWNAKYSFETRGL